MYQPAHHREDRLDIQHALIRAFPLGTLVTVGPSGLVANHVPFLIDPEASKLGTLRAHIARANPRNGASSIRPRRRSSSSKARNAT
jgi:transcriptional regulator